MWLLLQYNIDKVRSNPSNIDSAYTFEIKSCVLYFIWTKKKEKKELDSARNQLSTKSNSHGSFQILMRSFKYEIFGQTSWQSKRMSVFNHSELALKSMKI